MLLLIVFSVCFFSKTFEQNSRVEPIPDNVQEESCHFWSFSMTWGTSVAPMDWFFANFYPNGTSILGTLFQEIKIMLDNFFTLPP